ncbi:hypothetical protein PVK06_009520 [Gossypium arboreum]|uniref:Uncharacterized protein n=1 Tax=Gossypium arboreum TaxID=29729 RepID=A0ABR0QNX7_GOSAR|nr:hypothetical protein PVK06_009520 [Gossypium arboreum]
MDFAVGVNSSEIPKAAYKLTILGASSEKNNGGFLEEKFTLLDGGAITKIPDCLPMVTRVFNKSEWYGVASCLEPGLPEVEVCPRIVMAPPVEESSCTRPIIEKSGLEKNVDDEPYGSWMVVERRRGNSRASNEGKMAVLGVLLRDLTLQC